jgi:multicomponent Na+:H+ antiporter subunit C
MIDVIGVATWLPHVVYVLLVAIGLFVLVNDENLVKKVVGLNIFQTGIFLFFITSAYRTGARAPLVTEAGPFVNPLPHVLILTAIVVGVSVTGVALALIVRLYDAYGTLREDVIRDLRAAETREDASPAGATDGGEPSSSAATDGGVTGEGPA